MKKSMTTPATILLFLRFTATASMTLWNRGGGLLRLEKDSVIRYLGVLAFLVFAVFFRAGNDIAFSSPLYAGSTFADYGVNGNVVDPLGDTYTGPPGYYLWSNDEAMLSWSVRWTGSGPYFVWRGKISVGDNLQTTTEVLFEDAGAGGPDVLVIGTLPGQGDVIEWETITGHSFDGINFTLRPDTPPGRLITFELASTMWTFGGPTSNITGSDIYIGQNADVPQVDIQDIVGLNGPLGMGQAFEISAPVPEPATMLLLGSGLVGLAGFRRKLRKS